jgi:hypothetical protein
MFFLLPFKDSLPGSWKDLRLDIVGIIAILGDGGVTRNAQVSALSWYNNIPRLLPAPQALLKQERDRRLPTQSGTVVGVYSGNVRHDLNFFINVLHPHRLENYQVELLKVDPKGEEAPDKSYGARSWGELFCLSVVGCAMSVALIVLSAIYQDGMSMLATIFLSTVSSLVGISSHWKLDFPKPKVASRKEILPPGDVVIYYPNGAFRVIRCKEETSRLYFQVEGCKYSVKDTPYRSIALLATILLMLGVICLSNATLRLQLAFATAYIILNALYWGVSAVNPVTNHWKHAFDVTPINYQILPKGHNTNLRPGMESQNQSKRSPEVTGDLNTTKRRRLRNLAVGYRMSNSNSESQSQLQSQPDRTMTTAMWIAIALTGTSKWLNDSTQIAPVSDAWKEWLAEADRQARSQFFRAGRIGSKIQEVHAYDSHPVKIRCNWDYKKALADILTKKKPDLDSKRPNLDETETRFDEGKLPTMTEADEPELLEPAPT